MRATCPAISSSLTVSEKYRFEAPHYIIFPNLFAYFLFLGSNILLSILLLNTLSLCFPRRMKDKVSHSYNAMRQGIVLHILMFRFFDRKRTDIPLKATDVDFSV